MIRTDWPRSPAGPIALVKLNRPEKKNAMTPAMLDDLCTALSEAAAKARAIVLGGEGSTFCAGFDLTLCKDNSDALAALLRGLSSAIRLMRDLPCPVIVAAQGAAIAGGCALVCAGDMVITHAECKFGYPVVRLGISPAVNAPYVANAVGGGRTRERLLGGQIFCGREAFELGLAQELAGSPEQVVQAAISLAQTFATKPRCGVEATKSWLNALDGSTNADLAGLALAASLKLVGTPEERERLTALWA